MPIKSLKTVEEFRRTLTSESSDRLLVFQFTAKWCGPCKAIAPKIIEISNKILHVKFFKIDLDEAKEIAASEGVTSIPTFKLYKNNGLIEELTGGQCVPRLEELIQLHQGPSEDVASKFGISGQSDITSLIQRNQVESLNIKNEHNINNVFDSKNEQIIESDADEQIIINVGFSQAVKIHSIKFEAPLSNAPNKVKLFVNKTSLGFDDATSIEPTQELELNESDYDENAITNLRYVKFQSVNSLSIFIEDNLEGDDVTMLKRITILGQPLHTTNMNDLNRN